MSTRTYPYSCIVKGCPGRNALDIKLFRFPEKDVLSWCSNLGISPNILNTRSRLCSRHFHEDCLGWTKLKPGAQPTINLGYEDCSTPIIYPALSNTKELAYKRHERRCHVKGCSSVNPPQKLFKFPDETDKRNEWKAICHVEQKYLNLKHLYACAKHFKSNMIGKERLKPGAFPQYHLNKNDHLKRANLFNDNAYYDDDETANNNGILSPDEDSLCNVEIKEEIKNEYEIFEVVESVMSTAPEDSPTFPESPKVMEASCANCEMLMENFEYERKMYIQQIKGLENQLKQLKNERKKNTWATPYARK